MKHYTAIITGGTFQEFARVYADYELTAVPSDKTIFLRRMCVAD